MTESEWVSSTDPAAMLAHVQDKASPRRLRLFACACCRAVWDGVPCPNCVPTDRPDLDDFRGCSLCHDTRKVGGLTDPRSRRAVEVAERFADALATEGELLDAGAHAGLVPLPGPPEARTRAPILMTVALSQTIADAAGCAGRVIGWSMPLGLAAPQAGLLRDVFGNPFRPVTLCGLTRKPFHTQHAHVDENGGFWLESECPVCARLRTPAAVALARTAYEGEPCSRCGERGFNPGCHHGSKPEAFDPTLLPLLADALEAAGCTEAALLAHLRGQEPEPGSWHRCRGCGQVYRHTGKYSSCDMRGCGEGQEYDEVTKWRPLRGPHVRGCWALDLVLGKE
jgi:hypothetical protein